MPTRKFTKAHYEQIAAFRFALRQFLRFSEEAAHGAGLTPQQHQALLAIKGFPSRDHVTVGELAERLQIQHHSAVGLADRLAAEKLIQREQSQEDRRQVILHLTARGEELLDKLTAVHREELRRIGPDLGAMLEKLSA
jgi:DNA-binding MarR family transcriptional regulator